MMTKNRAPPATAEDEAGDLGYAAWITFWGQLIVLGVVAALGASYASADAVPGDYACGLLLTVAAIALAFVRLKNRFDGSGSGGGSCLVEDMANLVAVIVVFTILALAGLFIGAGVDQGGLHDAGVALFAVSAIAVFLSIKHVFDTLERTR